MSELAREFSLSVPDADLVFWTMGGMTDLSRFRHVLTRNGGVKAGHQMEFDGTGADYISGPATTLVAAGVPRTIALWYNTRGTPGCLMRFVGTSRFQFIGRLDVATFTTNAADDMAGGSVVLNQWRHAAIVYSATSAQMYENGAEVDNVAVLTGTLQSLANLTIGRYTAIVSQFDGPIRDVRIYAAAKSADWVGELYEATERFY